MAQTHGQIDAYDNFQVYLGGCPGECFPSGLVYPAEWGLPFGTTVELYGTGVGVVHMSELWILALWGTSMTPSTCLVAVQPVAWSTLKRLYK